MPALPESCSGFSCVDIRGQRWGFVNSEVTEKMCAAYNRAKRMPRIPLDTGGLHEEIKCQMPKCGDLNLPKVNI